MRRKQNVDMNKVLKTINFDAEVLKALEKRSANTGVSASNIVNNIIRRNILGDEAFYTEMQKYHFEKAMGYQFMKDQVKIKQAVNNDL